MFNSSLVLQTKTNKIHKLPHNTELFYLNTPFAVTSCDSYIVTFDKNEIVIYSTYPFTQTKSIPYGQTVESIASLKGMIVLASSASICLYQEKYFSTVEGSFENTTVSVIEARNRFYLGIQYPNKLEILDGSGKRHGIFACQCSWSGKDVLLLADGNALKVQLAGTNQAEILLPSRIAALTADHLLTNIFCACEDGNVYAVSACGKELRTFQYHEKPAKILRISFCGQYLYSCDGHLLCMWSIDKGVVIGMTEYEEEVTNIEVVLRGERKNMKIPDFL